MTFEQLLGILKIPSLVKIDPEKKIITITTPIVTIGPLSYTQARSFVDDKQRISNFLKETFVERKIMWHDFKKETLEWSKVSITEISNIANVYWKEIEDNNNIKDFILVDYLKAFESLCKLTLKAIREAETDERDQRNSGLPLDDIFFAKDQLEFILKDFREKTYPMVKSLTMILPDDGEIRKLSAQKLKDGCQLLKIDADDIEVTGLE